MSKKKKKNISKAIFGMSVDEQKNILEELEEIEKGKASILDLGVTPTKRRMTQSAYTQAISDCIESRKRAKREEEEETNKKVSPPTLDHVPFTRPSIQQQPSLKKEDVIAKDSTAHSIEVPDPGEIKYVIRAKSLPDDWILALNNLTNDLAVGNTPVFPFKVLTKEVIKEVPVEVEKKPEYPTIRIRIDEVTAHCFIDDGIVSTPINAIAAWTKDINHELIPQNNELLSRLFSSLYFHIITTKYPSCIMDVDTFLGLFKGVKSLDPNKFAFFKQDKFIYAYVIEEDAYKHFYSAFDTFNLDKEQQMQFIVNAAVTANVVHNAFPATDEDEVERVLEIRHNVTGLYKMIIEDPETVFDNEFDEDPLDALHVISLPDFKADVLSNLSDLTDLSYGLDDDDDDEDYDDDEDEEDEDDEEEEAEERSDGSKIVQSSYTGMKYDPDEDDAELEALGIKRKTLPRTAIMYDPDAKEAKRISIENFIKDANANASKASEPAPDIQTSIPSNNNKTNDGSMTVPVFHRPKK